MIATSLLHYDFMRRALLAALLIGLAAPAVGIFLVQRRLALIGDGLGHIAVTGVALGLVLNRAPVPIALVTAVVGAVVVELIRARGEQSAEIALAILFYGGIGGGVVLVSQAPSGARSLNQYLFGSITTTSSGDLRTFAILAAVVLVVSVGLGTALFSVSNDDEFARASGLPVMRLNLLLAALSAFTVVVSMRVVGVLLVSALMVVPVAAAQLIARSFRMTFVVGIAIGVVVSVSGVVISYYADTPSGGTIVLLAIGVFALLLIAKNVGRLLR
ncbi:MAG: ABC-type Mn2+/Zn2+ transport system, permease component [Ilumatobacteraceae bacterium]|nr:ABC-type Mn2+/Zn2+ transport system, permease component [Ilumatobacteraceae bacterium]